jgi:hypothetical protein
MNVVAPSEGPLYSVAVWEIVYLVDSSRKRETADEEKTTHCSTSTQPGATQDAQPETHVAAPGVLQMASEKPA